MPEVRFTLVGDGRFDQTLLPILNWLVHASGVQVPIQGSWADLEKMPRPTRALKDRIARAAELWPCDLLYVHRDAESAEPGDRIREIERAFAAASSLATIPQHVPVIPVRMTEAWLLFSEDLIRQAAGNPSGRLPLSLPGQWERLVDPKETLHEALRKASGHSGRRLASFNAVQAAYRVAELATDFSPLRLLPTFRQVEEDTAYELRVLGLL